MSDKKRPLKKRDSFSFPRQSSAQAVPERGAPKQQAPARGLTLILTPYRWQCADTGSREKKAALHQGPALRDHLDMHKEKLNAGKVYSGGLKANPLEHINDKDWFSEWTKSSW